MLFHGNLVKRGSDRMFGEDMPSLTHISLGGGGRNSQTRKVRRKLLGPSWQLGSGVDGEPLCQAVQAAG